MTNGTNAACYRASNINADGKKVFSAPRLVEPALSFRPGYDGSGRILSPQAKW